MTLEEFFVAFAAIAPTTTWVLEQPHTFRRAPGLLLRTHFHGVCCCPLSFLDHQDATEAVYVARARGLDDRTRIALMGAADEMPLHEPWIRARLLTLAGVKEAV